ncbi:phospholipase D-like domain-containing protein [Delftia acidovorans]|uniref:phospholipase D-like domain-containing protein n=1 Tax=Delftia acidovorans TaxID=80866 RepID=UPI00148217C6|nr:phospholipase D-like domain-containing protein [Delftia acidovorans]
MQKLLYHAPENPTQESPFDRAIVQVVHQQEVGIVSPYIGVKYLRRIIGMSQSWRLISDVLEWLSATPVKERINVYEFLKEHDGLIHHYPAIHAKTVVSSTGAYTGSANLTDAGVLRRTEFGVLITDPFQVQEVKKWFDIIWSQTSPPPLHSVLELIGELNKISSVATQFADMRATQLESGARRVRARLVKILGHEPLPINVRLRRDEVARRQAVVSEELPHAVLQPPNTTQSRSSRTLSFDLEAEIGIYISRNSGKSFKFAEVHAAMRQLEPLLSMRETYLAILESCASHPRSLFSEDSLNRLVYIDGRFFQSSKEKLFEVLEPMDELVSWIIDVLSFEEKIQKLPSSYDLFMSTFVVNTVLKGMINAGFVRQNDGLSLSENAVWTQRLKLLEKSYRKWSARLTKFQFGVPKENIFEKNFKTRALQKYPSKPEVDDDLLVAASAGIDIYKEGALQNKGKLDRLFSYLARLHGYGGEFIELNVETLTTKLMDLSGLDFEEVTRLISGTYSFFRSPFIILQTGSKNQSKVITDLVDNLHLKDLPMTNGVIANSQALKRLAQPLQAQSLDRNGVVVAKAQVGQRFADITIEQADQAYYSICKRIFESIKSPMMPLSRDALLWSLCGDGVKQDLARRLIFGSWGTQFNLFELVYHKRGALSINLIHKNLNNFHRTHSYLKEVVWACGRKHSSLSSLENIREDVNRRVEKAIIKELEKKSSKRDAAYAALLTFIISRIPQETRYETYGELVRAMAGAKLDIFVIEFLLGVGKNPPKQLLNLKTDKMGYFLRLDHQALKAYTRCKKILTVLSDDNKPMHSWLMNSIKSKEAPRIELNKDDFGILSRSVESIFTNKKRSQLLKEDKLSPLVWDDLSHLKLDNLYSELVKLYIDHGSSVILSLENTWGIQNLVLEKYLKICEFFRENKNIFHPVLSLRISEDPKNLELVIYSSFRENIPRFPKLQRLLFAHSLQLREV